MESNKCLLSCCYVPSPVLGAGIQGYGTIGKMNTINSTEIGCYMLILSYKILIETQKRDWLILSEMFRECFLEVMTKFDLGHEE